MYDCVLSGVNVSGKKRSLTSYYALIFQIIGHRELCRRLGVTQLVNHGKNAKAIRFRNTDELILSPRRGRRSLHTSFTDDIVDRNRTATPPIRAARAHEESVSGYDGDLEEEDSDGMIKDRDKITYSLWSNLYPH